MSLENYESITALKDNFFKKIKLHIKIIFVLFLIQTTLIISLYSMLKPRETYITTKYITCKLNAFFLKDSFKKTKINFKNPDGNYVIIRPHIILENNDIIEVFRNSRNSLILLFFATSPMWILRKYLLKKLNKISENKYDKIHIRGANLLENKKYIKELKNTSDLIFGDIPITEESSKKHTFIIGRPGAGKSQACLQLLEPISNKNIRCIIHDPKMEYVKYFYNPEKDIIFNPVDERSINWNIFNEIKTIMDIEAISTSLIPESKGEDKFWNDAARTIFSGILSKLVQDEDTKNNAAILDMILTDASVLIEHFLETDGAKAAYRFLHTDSEDENIARHAPSILATLMQYTKCYEYMAKMDNNEENFSLYNWLKNGEGSIFITNNANIKDTLKPVLSLFIDLLGRKLLSMDDNKNRVIYFLLDEFGSLQKLPTIVDILTKARSKGGRAILATQDFGIIDEIYGKNIRQSIINSCANKIFFCTEDESNPKIISDIIGEEEFYRTEKTTNSKNKGFSLSKRTKKSKLILPSEIQQLQDLNAIVKQYNMPYVKARWEYKEFKKINETFVVNEKMFA